MIETVDLLWLNRLVIRHCVALSWYASGIPGYASIAVTGATVTAPTAC